MVLSGEARRARQIVKVLNSEGKVIAYAKPHYPMVNTSACLKMDYVVSVFSYQAASVIFFYAFKQVKGSDTSTAESGSEAEDIASPKAIKSYSHLRLTPVREEVGFHFFIL